MSDQNEPTLPEAPAAASRRQFLGSAAVAAAAVAGVPALLAACGESVTDAQPRGAAAPTAPRASLNGGRDPGVTLHKMMAGTIAGRSKGIVILKNCCWGEAPSMDEAS